MLGIAVDHKGKTLNIRARKAVDHRHRRLDRQCRIPPHVRSAPDRGILRRSPGMPWSNQDASGELAAMAIGASLWGLFNQTSEFGAAPHQGRHDRLPVRLSRTCTGCPAARCSIKRPRLRPAGRGLAGRHPRQHAGPALLRRDRRAVQLGNNYKSIDPYNPRQLSQRQGRSKFNPNNFINAALGGIGDGHNGGGPIWAIFDADAVARENWDPKPPNVDIEAGFFFTADTIARVWRARS